VIKTFAGSTISLVSAVNIRNDFPIKPTEIII
jgi:hypothetical protein